MTYKKITDGRHVLCDECYENTATWFEETDIPTNRGVIKLDWKICEYCKEKEEKADAERKEQHEQVLNKAFDVIRGFLSNALDPQYEYEIDRATEALLKRLEGEKLLR